MRMSSRQLTTARGRAPPSLTTPFNTSTGAGHHSWLTARDEDRAGGVTVAESCANRNMTARDLVAIAPTLGARPSEEPSFRRWDPPAMGQCWPCRLRSPTTPQLVGDLSASLRTPRLRDLSVPRGAHHLADTLTGLGVPPGQLTLDLRGVSFLDSSGLSMLLELHKQCATNGGALRLIEPPDHVWQLLKIAGLDEHFTVAGSWPTRNR